MCTLHISGESRQRKRALKAMLSDSYSLVSPASTVWGQYVQPSLSAAYDYPKVLYCL